MRAEMLEGGRSAIVLLPGDVRHDFYNLPA